MIMCKTKTTTRIINRSKSRLIAHIRMMIIKTSRPPNKSKQQQPIMTITTAPRSTMHRRISATGSPSCRDRPTRCKSCPNTTTSES